MKPFWLLIRFPLIWFAFTLLFLWLGDVVNSRFGNYALPVTLAFWTISAIPWRCRSTGCAERIGWLME